MRLGCGDRRIDRELRSRTAAEGERLRQSSHEYLTGRKVARVQLVFDHPFHRPPFLFA